MSKPKFILPDEYRARVPEDKIATYECDFYEAECHKEGCMMCKHLTHVIYDTIHGPYLFTCELDTEDDPDMIDKGFFGECKLFEPETKENTNG